jgi:NAD(P)-dependent dehydrogenase (short-subunit alcohol dehydrogenase family)
VKEAIEKFGRLDIAVNNAGIGGPQKQVGEYEIEEWDKVVGINLSGVFYGMRYQIPEMLKNNKGSIINVASILGSVGFAQSCAYVAAKHGVVGLTKTAALEYSAQGIRVNSVGPAFIKTPLLEDLEQELLDQLVSLHPIGRLGEPEEVAQLILWLAGEKSSFDSGAYYPLDGGYLAR